METIAQTLARLLREGIESPDDIDVDAYPIDPNTGAHRAFDPSQGHGTGDQVITRSPVDDFFDAFNEAYARKDDFFR